MDNNNLPHILLIEDDQFFRELLSRKLREKECIVTEKENLGAARAALKTTKFHVVCFDLVVLGMEGLKKLSELMTSDWFPDTAVLLLTDGEIEAEAAKLAPAVTLAHLVKSEVTPEEVVSRIVWLAARPRVV